MYFILKKNTNNLRWVRKNTWMFKVIRYWKVHISGHIWASSLPLHQELWAFPEQEQLFLNFKKYGEFISNSGWKRQTELQNTMRSEKRFSIHVKIQLSLNKNYSLCRLFSKIKVFIEFILILSYNICKFMSILLILSW